MVAQLPYLYRHVQSSELIAELESANERCVMAMEHSCLKKSDRLAPTRIPKPRIDRNMMVLAS